MNKKFLGIFGIFILFLCGCAKLQHMDQLLTLKGVADEQKKQQKYVENQDKKFEQLREAVKTDKIKKFSNQKQIVSKFGQPIYTKSIEKDGQTLELWIYRYSVQYFNSDKILLYFDPDDKLVNSVYEPAPESHTDAADNSNHP